MQFWQGLNTNSNCSRQLDKLFVFFIFLKTKLQFQHSKTMLRINFSPLKDTQVHKFRFSRYRRMSCFLKNTLTARVSRYSD